MLSYHLYMHNIEDSAQPNNKLNNVTKQSFTNTLSQEWLHWLTTYMVYTYTIQIKHTV